MLAVSAIVGNIFHDKSLMQKYRRMEAAGSCEKFLLLRMEMERTRLRRRTEKGTDVGLVLQEKLHHGDVLVSSSDRFILVEQAPEKVLSVRIKEKDPDKIFELSALVGHTIGNRHRPIAIDGDRMLFPIQADSEAEFFKNLLKDYHVELAVEDRIFQPHERTESHHEH